MKLAIFNSVLGNTSPEILHPVESRLGIFQIAWVEAIASHGLFLDRGAGFVFVASHHNGYSLARLSEFVLRGDTKAALRQVVYIRDCGGTVTNDEFFI
jgi:hypothetical protein